MLLVGLGAGEAFRSDERTLAYVGASRARHRLYVFRRPPQRLAPIDYDEDGEIHRYRYIASVRVAGGRCACP